MVGISSFADRWEYQEELISLRSNNVTSEFFDYFSSLTSLTVLTEISLNYDSIKSSSLSNQSISSDSEQNLKIVLSSSVNNPATLSHLLWTNSSVISMFKNYLSCVHWTFQKLNKVSSLVCFMYASLM